MQIKNVMVGTAAALILAGPILAGGQHQPQGTDTGHMAKMHEQMMTDMKAADAKLDALVSAMNAARGDDARLDAVVTVINELARQKKGMSEKMEHMHQHMMQMSGAGKPETPSAPPTHQH